MKIAAAIFIGLIALGLGALYFFQNRLIYFPVRYLPDAATRFHRPLQRLEYKLDGLDQVAFYIPPLQTPPDADMLPSHLWVLFYGNAGPVLRYDHWLQNFDASPDGFLLVDYPGFGFNAGSPSPKSATESAQLALDTLAKKFSISPPLLEQRMGALGVSLGAAAALQFVLDHPAIHHLIMIAPFTSLKDMARLRFGPLRLLARNAYDNEAGLHALAARTPRPTVSIFHGDADETVPVTMGRTLALENSWVSFREIPGASHSDILDRSAPLVAAALAQADEMP